MKLTHSFIHSVIHPFRVTGPSISAHLVQRTDGTRQRRAISALLALLLASPLLCALVASPAGAWTSAFDSNAGWTIQGSSFLISSGHLSATDLSRTGTEIAKHELSPHADLAYNVSFDFYLASGYQQGSIFYIGVYRDNFTSTTTKSTDYQQYLRLAWYEYYGDGTLWFSCNESGTPTDSANFFSSFTLNTWFVVDLRRYDDGGTWKADARMWNKASGSWSSTIFTMTPIVISGTKAEMTTFAYHNRDAGLSGYLVSLLSDNYADTIESAELPPTTWAPTFTSSPPISSRANVSLSYHVTLNETGTVTALNLPSWASLTHNGSSSAWYINGTTPWTSSAYTFKLKGQSTAGTLYAYQNWTLTIGRWAPSFVGSPDLSILKDSEYSYTPHLNESGTIQAVTLPNWATFDDGSVSGTPTISGAFDFGLRAVSTNGTRWIWQNWTVEVGAWASHFDSSPILTGIRNMEYTYEPVTNETATITADELPEWATFEDNTVTGTPDTIGPFDFSLKAIGSGVLPAWQNWTVEVSPVGFIGVDGIQLTIDGSAFPSDFQLVGVDETTAWTFAVRAYCEGISGDWGKNMNFPVPDTGKLNVSSLSQLWQSYFGFVTHYGLNLVRFSSGDQWATTICYQAWLNHPTEYFEVLEEMAHQAAVAGVYFELNMAGGSTATAPNYFYDYGGTGEVTTHDHAIGTAYHNYLDYITATIQHLDISPYTNAVFAYDVYNEPDGSPFWAHDQVKFRTWARVIANDTTPLTTHIVDMGVGGGGDLAGNFGWGFASFYNATGGTGFDICHRHAYFSAEDDYLVRDPLHWSTVHCGKPLFVGEVAKSYYADGHWYTLRWPWWESKFIEYGGQAYCNLLLAGTEGYPSYGSWAPTFTSSPDTTGLVGVSYEYQPVTNESVTLTLENGPEWMTFDDGALGGVPDTPGNFNVSLNATSIVGGLTTWQNWTITIGAFAPEIITTPSGLGAEGDLYEYNALADQTVTWSLSGTAWFLDVNPLTGEVVGIPDTAGVYLVKLVATNEFDLKDWQNWTITVAHTYGDDGGGTNPPPGGNDNSVIFNLSLDMWIVVGVGILILMVAIVSVRRR